MAMTTAQRTDAYRFFAIAFNAAPGATYMSQLYDAYTAGMTTQQIVNVYTTKPQFLATYPTYLSDTDFATKLVNNIVKASATDAAKAQAVSDIVASLGLGQSRGDVIYTIFNNLANKLPTDADWGATAKQMANQVVVAQYYTETLVGDSTNLATLQSVISNVTNTSDVSTPDKILALIPGGAGVGQTYTLTAGADSFTGGAGNDTFNAGASNTWSAFDSIDGGSGTDTMTVLTTGTTAPGGVTLKNVEILTVNTSGAGYTIDSTGYTGLTTLNVNDADTGAGAVAVTAASTTTLTINNSGTGTLDVVGGGGNLSLGNGAGAVTVGGTTVVNAYTSATVVGGSTVQIHDNKTTAQNDGTTLTSVSLKGNTGAAQVWGNGVTSLTLDSEAQNATITSAAGTRALTVNLKTVTGGTVADAEATTLTVKATTGNSSAVTLNAAKATTVAIDATGATLGVADVNIAAATSLTITGDKKTTIGAMSTVTALTSVDASAATGGTTITPALGAGVAYTGGSGVDTITTTTGATKAIATGAGNDVVTYGGPVGTGGSINGGDGTDTIQMTAAQAVTATGSTTFKAAVTNFEVLKLSAATGAAAAINMANAGTGVNTLSIAGATVGALTVTGAAADFTLEQRALTSFASSVALASDTGTSDNVNLKYTAADGFTSTAAITIANVESLKITTTDADTTAQTAVIVTPITAAAATTVTVGGDMGVSLIGGMTQTTLTSLDASGLTASGAFGGLTWTSGALAAAATVKGGAAGTNTIDFSAATKAVTYTGGTGADTLNFASANTQANVIDLGNGTNTVNGGTNANGNNTITGGTGADTIKVGTGGNTISTGAGNDVVEIGASTALNTVDVGTGTDTVTLKGIQSAAGYYTTITGMSAGDIIDISAVIGTANALSAQTAMGSKITLGGAASFANYLDAAAASTLDVGADSNLDATVIKWFQFGGNTYIVEDTSVTATFKDGSDSVVCLTGTVDLSSSTIASGVITLV